MPIKTRGIPSLCAAVSALVLLAACRRAAPEPRETLVVTPSPMPSATPVNLIAPTPTLTPTVAATPTATLTPTDLPIAPPREPQTHTVQEGESLWQIAFDYGVSVEALVAVNNLPNADVIQAGQVLLIPGDPVDDAAGGCTLTAAFVADITIPDDTIMEPNEIFTTTWRLRNDGTCTWDDDYRVVFLRGTLFGDISFVPVSPTDPGDEVDISVVMVAPEEPGSYISVWQLQSPDGILFGTQPYVQIIIPGPSSQGAQAVPPPDEGTTPTPSPTPDDTQPSEADSG